MVFFDSHSLDELAFRSYEIYLLKKFASEQELECVTGVTKWTQDCDVLLAYLSGQFGYTNFKAFARHPVWFYITKQSREK